MPRVIGLLSGKGGVGKTTVTANLGAALTHVFRKNALIFDMNVHASHLGLHFGIYQDPPVTLRDVLEGDKPIIQAIYIHPSTGIRIIPAPLDGTCENPTEEKLAEIMNQIKNNYDMVLLDCAPGLGREAMTAMSAIDDALIITTADIPSVTDAMKIIKILRRMNKNILGVVINRWEKQKYALRVNEIESTCNCNVIAKIPEDKKIPESISKGVPTVLLYPKCGTSKSFKGLAGYLVGEAYREQSLGEKIRNFLGLGKPSEKEKMKKTREREISDVERMKKEIIDEVREELKKEMLKMKWK